MRFANEYDIERYLRIFDDGATPNLFAGARIVARLAIWANENSDGWAYWPKPCRSAARLLELLDGRVSEWYSAGMITDISEAELRKACAPIKAFLTRQGVDHSEVF